MSLFLQGPCLHLGISASSVCTHERVFMCSKSRGLILPQEMKPNITSSVVIHAYSFQANNITESASPCLWPPPLEQAEEELSLLPDMKFMICLNWYFLCRDDGTGCVIVPPRAERTRCSQHSAFAALTHESGVCGFGLCLRIEKWMCFVMLQSHSSDSFRCRLWQDNGRAAQVPHRRIWFGVNTVP